MGEVAVDYINSGLRVNHYYASPLSRMQSPKCRHLLLGNVVNERATNLPLQTRTFDAKQQEALMHWLCCVSDSN